MTIERIFKGPLFVHPGLVSCAVCRYGIEDGELVFLVEEMHPDDDEAYVHPECVRAYLGLEDDDARP